MQVLAILMTLTRQSSCLRMALRWHYISLSGPGNDELLHLIIAYLNSSLEKELQAEVTLHLISLRILVSTWQLRAVLKDAWSTFHKLSRERQEWLLYWMALMTSSLCLLIQFINSQGPWLLFATSWIFMSKKDLFVFLTTFLNFFQLFRLLDIL